MAIKLLFIITIHAYVVTLAPGERWRAGGRTDQAIGDCLTGYMTDVQSWVDEKGDLTEWVGHHHRTVDLSAQSQALSMLSEQLSTSPRTNNVITVLSLAKCYFNRVPSVFHLKDNDGNILFETLEYITLYGNDFVDENMAGKHYGLVINITDLVESTSTLPFKKQFLSAWASGFHGITFSNLKELDLRKCFIQVLVDNQFTGMPKLEALYLGENQITHISGNAFYGLGNIKHLDFSRNLDQLSMEKDLYKSLKSLTSLDLSFSRMRQSEVNVLQSLGPNMQRLSLCYTGLTSLNSSFFNRTMLKYLDVSGNNGILGGITFLDGLQKTLEVLYADDVGLKTVNILYNFTKLEVLRLRNNEVSGLSPETAASLKNLLILDLTANRVTIWSEPLFQLMPRLKLLSLQENNINLMRGETLDDIANITYLAMGGNFMVCNCHAREFIEIAYRNEENYKQTLNDLYKQPKGFYFHKGFLNYYDRIKERVKVERVCQPFTKCIEDKDIETEADGRFVIIDYNPKTYQCLAVSEGKSLPLTAVGTCNTKKRGVDYDEMIVRGWRNILMAIIIPVVVFPVLILIYKCRRKVKYFFITMRNSAALSLINDKAVPDDDTIYNYDVFVSYCNEDRDWVLDYLLPHVEKNCNVSVCLHERDFQVGLSILENIVSCMDRSRSIMLIISQQFLKSQWCQFEMHLAQHRLLETRREDLILVLLEEIPRQLRPTTLHYLMLTKTYIVWPKNENEQPVFWRRLKRSLIMYRLMQPQNISLA